MEKRPTSYRQKYKLSKFLTFPLIDGMFLILTCFILVAISESLAPIRAVPLTHQPPAVPGHTYFDDKVLVEIDNPTDGNDLGKMHLNARSIPWYRDIGYDDMLSHLQNISPKHKRILLINADRDVFHEQIIRVIDIAHAAGISKVGFSVVNIVIVEPREVQVQPSLQTR